ncbi:hypothetical protein K488DRAFT_92367 [Vararia minispora EC-137]|uniref:Uncharacterized protein n=1 Tax=Vararia minispora EC-137 TaxID=1314806 RepID=A0ACB8Q4A3_9AGAM|nr:hypothetical protein K488DRAFT_92367 [Vararia minispora EC-137]
MARRRFFHAAVFRTTVVIYASCVHRASITRANGLLTMCGLSVSLALPQMAWDEEAKELKGVFIFKIDKGTPEGGASAEGPVGLSPAGQVLRALLCVLLLFPMDFKHLGTPATSGVYF